MKREDILKMAHDVVEKRAVESDCIEYKRSADVKDGILKTACAYCNNLMNREIGLIFIGIEEVDDVDKGIKAIPKRPILGVDEGKIESVENGLKSLLGNIFPKPNYQLLQDEIDGKTYIIVAVEPGNDGPYETKRQAENDKRINLKAGRYIRVRRDTRTPNSREEFELLKKFAEFHFSSELNETATIDDLNYEYMKEYLVATRAKDDIRSLPKLEMARAMGLVSQSEYGGYRAKNFAVLMFADKPQSFIPYARVELIREAIGTGKMVSQVFDGPVWIQAKRVIDFFREMIMTSYTIREPDKVGHRIVYNYPLAMFAELATNCILHKEYARKEYIGIYVYKDHISFVNHNRPVPPVTIEAMNSDVEFRNRVYLNPELKEMFFALDLIESYGSGIRRAKNAMKDNGSPELVFEPTNDDDDYTMVTAYINEEFARIQAEENQGGASRKTTKKRPRNNQEKTKKQPRNNQEKGAGKNDVERRVVEQLLFDPTVTKKRLAVLLGVGESKIRYYLEKLKRDGKIARSGSTKAGRWIVN